MSPLRVFLTISIAAVLGEACFGGKGPIETVEEALTATPPPRPQNENEYQLALREHQKKLMEYGSSAPYSSKFFEGIVYMASPSLHPKESEPKASEPKASEPLTAAAAMEKLKKMIRICTK